MSNISSNNTSRQLLSIGPVNTDVQQFTYSEDEERKYQIFNQTSDNQSKIYTDTVINSQGRNQPHENGGRRSIDSLNLLNTYKAKYNFKISPQCQSFFFQQPSIITNKLVCLEQPEYITLSNGTEWHILKKIKQCWKCSIYIAIEKNNDNNMIAIKKTDFYNTEDQIHKYLQTINHDNIVKIMDTVKESSELYIGMEYCDGGNLFEESRRWFNNRDSPIIKLTTITDILKIFLQITTGLLYLHQKNVTHRDIKPENIFITSNRVIKIGDFGLSVNKICDITGKYGTDGYQAPEIKSQESYSNKIDIWSLAVTFDYLLKGRLSTVLYHNDNTLSQEHLNNSISYYMFKNEQLVLLLQDMLKIEPQERISAEEVHKRLTQMIENSDGCV